ncbi:MAG: hypothetical protein HZB38_19130 [Planctomycetes bacterium]|nr:hypothetical protein [Planctomycetota bacterium]
MAGAIGISRLRANEHVKLPDGQFPFPMGRPLPTVPVSDADPHAAILAWRELTAEEIRTRTLPPLDKWALWEMNRDLAAVESRLRDECDRATASSSTAKSAEPIARTPITEAPVRESWLRKSGDCWTLQFWTREGKLEAAVLPPRRGFELIHYFVYEPWRLACEIPEVSSGMEALDSNALGHAAAELLRLKESRVGQTGDALIDIDDKIETIERYMRQNTRPGGDIKLVMGERERAINRIRTNIRAALDHAKQHAPAWVEHMSEAIDYTLDPVPGYRPHEMVNWII